MNPNTGALPSVFAGNESLELRLLVRSYRLTQPLLESLLRFLFIVQPAWDSPLAFRDRILILSMYCLLVFWNALKLLEQGRLQIPSTKANILRSPIAWHLNHSGKFLGALLLPWSLVIAWTPGDPLSSATWNTHLHGVHDWDKQEKKKNTSFSPL